MKLEYYKDIIRGATSIQIVFDALSATAEDDDISLEDATELLEVSERAFIKFNVTDNQFKEEGKKLLIQLFKSL